MAEQVRTHKVDAPLFIANGVAEVDGAAQPGTRQIEVIIGDESGRSLIVGSPTEILGWLEKVATGVRELAGLPDKPRLEILDVRDPDASSEVTVFIDGVEVSEREYEQYNVDPAAGYQLSDWRAETREVAGDTTRSEQFRNAIVKARKEQERSEFIEDDLAGGVEHYDGDGCAVYEFGYVVQVNGDPQDQRYVEDLVEDDTYRDEASDDDDVWLPVTSPVHITDDEDVHVPSSTEESGD